MDLKNFKSHIILHLIDHVTRFSMATVVKSKERDEIIKHLFKSWISIFGAPSKFFSDNGGEFSNEDFNAMCEAYNISVKKTAAEATFSNGLMERHNAILEEMLLKTYDECNGNIDIALQWVINAKNSLSNVHGFSPYQMVFGINPRLPNTLINKPPALEKLSESKLVSKHLQNMHTARRAFIESESSEKISRALRHNLSSYKNAIFLTGDSVYYKRKDNKRWRGPGKVIGIDGQQILIKHGSFYVRRHPSHVMLKENREQQQESTAETETTQVVNQSNEEKSETSITWSDDSDEEDNYENIRRNIENEQLQTVNSNNESKNDEATLSDVIEETIESRNEVSNNNAEEIGEIPEVSEQIDDRTNIPTISNPTLSEGRIPKKGDRISYKLPSHRNELQATVLGRAGRATGKNKYWVNIEKDDHSLASLN